ncbi:patatin-like phospholipase family protein [Evansella cellulosilytica]|uniref:Patatin n=1 Tax=Evansella cellulosilytica (strain ATCC 21833 / DSM 2522 / FERM P-1141 / JCM 9156 / N-4) TaxID=649639 RepID=E6TX06_EVAC2|nr:patatin-like phospholipase family protein [Evansella cellulosilytica]ADU29956.1 Patatin [Evansella cellulosilytica DSM 2522]
MLKVDGVFAGGGIKSFSFVGALRVMKNENIEFERLAGTSAGAIVAAFIKAGFTVDEIESILDGLDLEELLEPKRTGVIFQFYKWIRLYRNMGIYKGALLEKWLEEVLMEKGVKTFNDLPPGSLKMVASDITTGQLLVLPDDLKRYGIIPETFSVARAIRMSCSLPFFFEPVKLQNSNGKHSVIVDGGVLSNFPIWLFSNSENKKPERPVVGFRLTPSMEMVSQREVSNAFSMLHSMVETMWKAHDLRHISKLHEKNIVFIPVDKIAATQFSISEEEKKELIELGEKSTEKFLKGWSY